MNKQEKLDKLDELVLDKMIDCMENNNTEIIGELNTVVAYLAKNNAVAEKGKSTVEEDTQKRLEAAKKRRKNV